MWWMLIIMGLPVLVTIGYMLMYEIHHTNPWVWHISWLCRECLNPGERKNHNSRQDICKKCGTRHDAREPRVDGASKLTFHGWIVKDNDGVNLQINNDRFQKTEMA